MIFGGAALVTWRKSHWYRNPFLWLAVGFAFLPVLIRINGLSCLAEPRQGAGAYSFHYLHRRELRACSYP